MAENDISALSETVSLITRSSAFDSMGRWMAQSFLCNGIGEAGLARLRRLPRPRQARKAATNDTGPSSR